jgi:CBS domain containing-hemolysin-like protein
MARVAVVVAIVATPLGILLDEYILDLTAWMPGVPTVVSNGIVPLAIIMAGVCGFYRIMKSRYSANKNEAVQMIFVLFLTVFIILTLTGIWFRGSGMTLSWPFF